MASIKKEGNNWYYVFNAGRKPNGKIKQVKKRGFKTKKAAEQALHEALNAFNHGTFVQDSKMLYKDFLAEWFQTKETTIGQQTADVYRIYLNSEIIPKLGHYRLSELTILAVQSFVNKLHREGLSAATIRKIYNIIHNSLEYAVDFELVSKNVSSKVKLPKIQKSEMLVWSQEELQQFLTEASDDSMYTLFLMAATTGMRQGELLGLRWKDIDFKKGSLSIKQTLSHDGKEFLQGGKTKSSQRTVLLSEKTLALLKSHKISVSKLKMKLGPEYVDHDLVLCTAKGTPIHPSNVRRTMLRLIEKAKVPQIRFHDLRHTHATLLLEAGVNIKVISERLGHSDIKVTLETYSHVLPSMQEEAVRKLDKLIL